MTRTVNTPAEAKRSHQHMIYAAILATLAGANASTAATEPTAVLVPYRDLDLASPAGKAELDHRILVAARRACDEPRLPDAAQQVRISECTKEARLGAGRAVEQALAARKPSTELAQVNRPDGL
jgi:UrcA family protein